MSRTYGKKALMLCLCCCLIGVLAFSASAKVIDYNDYITNVSVDGENDVVTVRFPIGDSNKWEIKSVNASQNYRTIQGNIFRYSDIPSSVSSFRALYYPLDSQDLISVFDIPNDTVLNISIRVDSDYYFCNGKRELNIQYYDDAGKLLTSSYLPVTSWEPVVGKPITLSATLDKPENAVYIKLRVIFYECVNSDDFTVTAGDLYFTMSINSLLRQQQETGRTNELLEQVLDQMQAEEDKANNQGNEGVGQITDAIPNHSQGFMDALQGLASSMSYTGTDAKFTVPKASVPGIDGLFQGFDILDGTLQVDFEDYIQMMPENLLLLVQSLLTIALIVYCFKELYSTIGYVLTLKGGD